MTAHRNHVTAGDVINVYRDGVLIAENVYVVGAWVDGVAVRPLADQVAGSADVGIWRYHEFNDDAVTIEKVGGWLVQSPALEKDVTSDG